MQLIVKTPLGLYVGKQFDVVNDEQREELEDVIKLAISKESNYFRLERSDGSVVFFSGEMMRQSVVTIDV